MSHPLVQQIEQEQMQNAVIPEFRSGDTLVVKIKIQDGERTRSQQYEGVVIAKSNRGLNSSFTVRKMSHGEGVERVFQTYSKQIEEIVVKRRGDVRKAKLYHMRALSGRKARIREKIVVKNKAVVNAAAVETAPEQTVE